MVLPRSKKTKRLFKDEDLVSFTVDPTAIANAKRAGQDTWVSPEFSTDQKNACLERLYVRGKFNGNIKNLLQLEPSGLSEKELKDWYWGLRQEALYKIFCIINQSYSKSALKRSMESEGLQNALVLFDPPEGMDMQTIKSYPSGVWDLRESYDSVVKYISD
jgi:hypothetical protein